MGYKVSREGRVDLAAKVVDSRHSVIFESKSDSSVPV